MRMRTARLLTVALVGVGVMGLMPVTDASAATPECTHSSPFQGQRVPTGPGGVVRCLLRSGDSNSGVTALQDALHFCFGKSITIDGIFGTQTRGALIAVQDEIGTDPDGIYGPDTASKMLFIDDPQEVFPPPCGPISL